MAAKGVKVSDVKKYKTHFRKMTPGLKECYAYIKMMGVEDPGALLPAEDKLHLDFTISGTCSALANAIRICFMEECPVKSMEFDFRGMETDDKFILPEYLGERIRAVPINQEKDYSDIEIHLDFENETRMPVQIRSGDLIVKKGKKVLNVSEYMGTTIPLIKINPGRHVKSVMKVVTGLAKEDGNRFSNVSNIRYEALDGGKSSLTSTYTKFRIGISTHRNDSLENLVAKMHESLTSRLDKYYEEMDGVNDEYVSDSLIVQGDTLTFPLEYRSIPALIAHYCYLVDPNIPFVAATVKHPSADTGIIRIRHPQHIKVILAAIKRARADLDIILKAL